MLPAVNFAVINRGPDWQFQACWSPEDGTYVATARGQPTLRQRGKTAQEALDNLKHALLRQVDAPQREKQNKSCLVGP